ncbi:MBL fold metallo-hydrolase [Mycobacteroides abscessus]|uniref:MBL fold metallo-hydrolase n=1 Tax=Mycobacteroides abscessus TaxID=36809 RepID=UPI000C269CF9|nr:MBL fold metallo-hydrolase [Mycobacteroides abscessus]RIS65384.1 MBL fold metallo-hydrolase [Mycobacteroides abscessus]
MFSAAVRTFTVGDATVTQLTELDVWPIKPHHWYPALSDEQLVFAQANYAPSAVSDDGSELIFAIHNYVIELADTIIVVDSCSGNHKNRPLFADLHMLNTDYLTRLEQSGYSPEAVDIVVNTHLHLDHCGWNTRLVEGTWRPTFPAATYLFHHTELKYIRAQWESAPIDQWQDNGGWVYEDSILPVLEHAPHGFVKSGQVLHSYGSTHIRALDAGGHTPGHIAIEVRAADTGLLIAGDALHHPMQAQFPDLPFYADADPAQAVATRRALLGRCADENLKLLTAHFPAHSPLGVRRSGTAFTWDGSRTID